MTDKTPLLPLADVVTDEVIAELSSLTVKRLAEYIKGLDGEQAIERIYNEAIDDACNFVRDVARSNAQHWAQFRALEAEMRWLLTLRIP